METVFVIIACLIFGFIFLALIVVGIGMIVFMIKALLEPFRKP